MSNEFHDHFSMTKVYDAYPCIVCGESNYNDKRDYCSPSCRKQAYSYRRRFDRAVKILDSIGFQATWINSVQLEIRLPVFMQNYYPRCKPSFIFSPNSDRELDKGIVEFYQELDIQLGANLGTIIKRPYLWRHKHPSHAESWLAGVISVSFSFNDNTFACKKCHRMWFDCKLARPHEDDICTDCICKDLPF